VADRNSRTSIEKARRNWLELKKENERPANHANHAKPKGVAEPEQLPKEGTRFGLRSSSEVVLPSRGSRGSWATRSRF
jgi:hypothetical protein